MPPIIDEDREGDEGYEDPEIFMKIVKDLKDMKAAWNAPSI
jgi:hypothetical protein